MACSGAIATGGGGGVSLQTDLPGLASLVLTMGRSGLKRLAQAGVDVHTIICMSEIAEKCPASIEYRREISECRQAQRNETQWFYKVVELGAGTNFVADELLKKRAGENVVALLSAVLSVMSAKPCDNLLLKLFEAADADLDSTPGFAQLRSFRESLTPLAKKTQFKDRVFQYHAFLRQLPDLEADMLGNHAHAHHCIPSEQTAVNVILALSKLVQEDSKYVLEYYGLSGSAWVITYARHVLGLPVCVLSSPSNAVPVSGDYQSSKVFVHTYSGKGQCRLLVHGEVQEYFVTSSLGPKGCHGWQIDVSRVNVLDSCIPRSDQMRMICGVIVRSLTLECVDILANGYESLWENDIPRQARLSKYSVHCLPQIRQRALKVLTLMGFEIDVDMEIQRDPWTKYITGPSVHLASQEMDNLMPTRVWEEEAFGHVEDSGQGIALFDARGKRYLEFLFRLAEAASWLAFTDWDQNTRMLSTNFIHQETRHVISRLHVYIPGDPSKALSTSDEVPICWNMTALCEMAIIILLGKDEGRHWNTFPVSLAVHQQGIIFARMSEMQQSLDMNCCLLHILPGIISADGEGKKGIVGGREPPDPWLLSVPYTSSFRPTNMYPELSVRNHVEARGEEIIIVSRAFNDGTVLTLLNHAPDICSGGFYVSDPCTHGYHHKFVDDNPSFASICQGLVQDCSAENSVILLKRMQECKVWLQAVDQNPIGQWLVSRASTRPGSLHILQRDCCIECILDRFKKQWREGRLQRIISTRDIYIIHGRLEGEE